MNPEEVAGKIDHTILKSTASLSDISQLCEEAKTYKFRGVCVNPVWVETCHLKLKKNGSLVVAVIDFPLGQGGYTIKHFGATLAKAKGADEIDVVWNIGAFLRGDYKEVLRELKPLVNVLPTKVIVETGYFTGSPRKVKRLLRDAALLVAESGAFCIKTSTGLEAKIDLGAKLEHIRIFKETVPDLNVKAAGGIKSLEDLKLAVGAGADIIGTSSGTDIMEEAMKETREVN